MDKMYMSPWIDILFFQCKFQYTLPVQNSSLRLPSWSVIAELMIGEFNHGYESDSIIMLKLQCEQSQSDKHWWEKVRYVNP